MIPAEIRPPGPVVIDIENITKNYVMGEETVHALRGVRFKFGVTNTWPLWARVGAANRPS